MHGFRRTPLVDYGGARTSGSEATATSVSAPWHPHSMLMDMGPATRLIDPGRVLFAGGVKSGAIGRHPAATVFAPRTSTAVCIRSASLLNPYRRIDHVRLLVTHPKTKPRALSERVQLSGRPQFQILSSQHCRFLPRQQAKLLLLSRATPQKLHPALATLAQLTRLSQQISSRPQSLARIPMS